jgi:N-acylneuraminate cytidylyltransferase
MKNIALIPLRGGSKSIPLKNIMFIGGKPLCQWVIEAAVKSKIFDKIIISTDSLRIKNVVLDISNNVEVIDRPDNISQDDSTTESVMLHTASLYDFDIMTTIQATSPLTTSGDFIIAYDSFKKNNYDSLLTCVENNHFMWSKDCKPLNYDPSNRPMRQSFDGCLSENGAFYMTTKECLLKHKCRLGGNIGIHLMPSKTMIEIDEPEDWNIIEAFMK